MRAGTVLLTAIGALLATGSIAAAETGAIVVYGKAKPHEREVVASAVAKTLRDASWSVDDAPFSTKDLESLKACLGLDRPWPCVAPTARHKGVQRIVVVQVELEDGGNAVVVTGQVLVASDAVPSIERRFCQPCSDAFLDQSVTEMTTVLLDRVVTGQSTTAIDIQTIPPGASVVIDGTVAGTSDKTVEVSAGPHQVQVQRSGYRPESKSIIVHEGSTTKMVITLAAAEGGTSAGTADRRSRVMPGLIVGAGTVALVGGIAYSLTIDPPRTFEQPQHLYSGPALAVAAAGGVAIGVGLYLWFRHPERRSAPVATFAHGGGVVGWSTSF